MTENGAFNATQVVNYYKMKTTHRFLQDRLYETMTVLYTLYIATSLSIWVRLAPTMFTDCSAYSLFRIAPKRPPPRKH